MIANAQQRSCFSADYLEQQKLEDPQRIKNLQEIERLTQEFIERNGNGTPEATVYTIPVVFHVVYNTAAQNISTAQVESQMTVLNEDFRRLNANQNNNWSQAADIEIEFCLATVDPNGNATDGITRTSTNVSVFSGDEVKYTAQGGHDAWPAGDYLNFWVCALDGFLGYAQFPGGPPATDGVVCDYRYTGTTGTATPPFNLGRTGTHEVGHWLNLYHIWGDGPCNQDDLVADTPASDAENYGCPNGHTSCGSLDMIENYMDYTDDACMNLFTQGQKTRMRALFEPGGFRESLLNSNGCNGGGGGGGNTCDTPTGLSTSNITNSGATASWNASANAVSYNVQIAAAGSGNWTTTNVSGTSHTFSGLAVCTSYDVRVQADCGGGDVSNYSSLHTFQTTGCPSGCQDNELTLTIVLDDYPEETTWEVKDGNTVLASGGPYSNAGSSVTEDICVPDGCYDFVIYDSYGDGICCAWGNGSYELTEDSNGASLASGGQFGSVETTNFCVPDGGGGGGGGGNCSYVTIDDEGFENGWGMWNDGGSDCRKRINDWPYATAGDFCVRLRDNTNTSVMTTDNMNLTDYEELTVDFGYYVRSFENVEDFWLQISTNGGGSYQTVEDWVLGTDFNNDEFHTDQVVIDGPFTSNTRLRFRCDASGNGDWVYIDEVVVSGCTNNGNRNGGEVIEAVQVADNQSVNTEFNIEKNHSPEMKLFPNPVENELTVNFKTDENLESDLLISDFSGKVMQQISLDGGVQQIQINVSDWAPGFYLVQLISGTERISKKFVVAR